MRAVLALAALELRRFLADRINLFFVLVLLRTAERWQALEARDLELAAKLVVKLGDPVLHVPLQLVQPLPEADDLLDAGKVHAQLLS